MSSSCGGATAQKCHEEPKLTILKIPASVNKVMELLLVTGKIPVDNKKDQAKNYVHR